LEQPSYSQTDGDAAGDDESDGPMQHIRCPDVHTSRGTVKGKKRLAQGMPGHVQWSVLLKATQKGEEPVG